MVRKRDRQRQPEKPHTEDKELRDQSQKKRGETSWKNDAKKSDPERIWPQEVTPASNMTYRYIHLMAMKTTCASLTY